MDTTRIGARQAQLILTTGVERLLKLKPGEVLQGHVLDTLPGGDVRLRIMGNLIQARSSMSLPPDTGVLLRVVGLKTADGPPEIRLQFLQTISPEETASEMPTSKNAILEALSRELALNLPSGGRPGQGVAATVEKLLKALPNDSSTLPGEVRGRLLSLIQTSLRSTGESIQNRLGVLLETQAWQTSPESADVAEALGRLCQDITKILDGSLQSTLENTGVTLEAKLAALARKLLAESGLPMPEPRPLLEGDDLPSQPPKTLLERGNLPLRDLRGLSGEGNLLLRDPKNILGGDDLPQQPSQTLLRKDELSLRDLRSFPGENDQPVQDPKTSLADGSLRQESHMGLDLKARLLQLRQLFLSQDSLHAQTPSLSGSRGEKGAEGERISTAQTLATVDGLLQDIESFQFLSKLTDSFYTFLPLAWEGLKEGEIAFKRNSASPGGRSHYCLIRLDFEQFGKLTIVAMMQAGDFLVSFKTDHEGMRDAINAHVHELEHMFEEQGLTLKGINVFSEGESCLEPFERLESFESIVSIKI